MAVDYSKHIGIGNKVEIVASETVEKQILSELRKISNVLKISNYSVTYSFSTSITTKQTIDLILEHGTYATSIYVDAEGGGFDLQINDTTHKMKGIKGLSIYDEIIYRISVTGYGNRGSSVIRVNLVK
jgi:hypothetical protein